MRNGTTERAQQILNQKFAAAGLPAKEFVDTLRVHHLVFDEQEECEYYENYYSFHTMIDSAGQLCIKNKNGLYVNMYFVDGEWWCKN